MTTYWVAPPGLGGSDSANGLARTSGGGNGPWATFAHAEPNLVAGDILYARTGTYSERVGENLAADGSAWTTGNYIYIAGDPTDVAASNLPEVTAVGMGDPNVHQYVWFQDFNCSVNAYYPVGVNHADGSGNPLDVYCRFVNVNSADPLIDTMPGFIYGNHTEMIRCSFSGATMTNPLDPGVHGVYVVGAFNLIDACVCFDNASYGIHLYSSDQAEAVHDNIVRNNTCYNNGFFNSKGGIIISSGDNNRCYNNLSYGNAYSGISVDYSSSSALIYHNVCVGNGGPGIYVGVGADDTDVRNNIFIGNSGGAVDDLGATTLYSNNFDAGDPDFVDGTGPVYDFHLEENSACIGNGTNLLSVVPTDFDGISRPNPPSQGAYEFAAAPSPGSAFGGALVGGRLVMA